MPRIAVAQFTIAICTRTDRSFGDAALFTAAFPGDVRAEPDDVGDTVPQEVVDIMRAQVNADGANFGRGVSAHEFDRDYTIQLTYFDEAVVHVYPSSPIFGNR